MALVDRHSGRQAQHVPLQVAAATAYFAITGRQISGKRDADTLRVLNDVAHAVANLAPIHVWEAATPRRLSPSELLDGRFDRGAMVFHTKSGVTHDRLTIERGDLSQAALLLREAGFKLR